jgi:hypothetical protein
MAGSVSKLDFEEVTRKTAQEDMSSDPEWLRGRILADEAIFDNFKKEFFAEHKEILVELKAIRSTQDAIVKVNALQDEKIDRVEKSVPSFKEKVAAASGLATLALKAVIDIIAASRGSTTGQAVGQFLLDTVHPVVAIFV